MVQIYAVIPLVLGCLAVLQGALNRRILNHLGLAHTVALNAAVLLSAGLAFSWVVRRWPASFPEAFRGPWPPDALHWWFLVPGCCGFAIVAGVPWTFSKVGALPVFVGIVAAQVVASAVWDAIWEGQPLTGPRILGGLLAIAAVVLVSWKS